MKSIVLRIGNYFPVLLIILILQACADHSELSIYLSENASQKEILAAKEIRRYFYLRTDKLLKIQSLKEPNSSPMNGIILASAGNQLMGNILPDSLISKCNELSDEGFILFTKDSSEIRTVMILGKTDQGVLYAAYRFAEILEVRFSLNGDIIPDEKTDPDLPFIQDLGDPLFSIRGILPFHDFPEGPDWWSLTDYKHHISQLVKLKMNFIGLHTYPESDFQGAYKAEPLVWIGTGEHIGENGSVKRAYPALHFNTSDTTWGYIPLKTSSYSNGAGMIFESDNFGAEYLPDLSPWPHTENENLELFNNVGEVLSESFSFAQKLGIKTCLGTETPLTIPDKMRNEVIRKHPNIDEDSLTKLVYEGIFNRITKTHPLDYYWLWTPENWTWSEVSDEEVDRTISDLGIAMRVAEELSTPFTLATCGWVLGPPRNRAEFNDFLPRESPFSCINRYVGFSRIESAFQDINDRPLWAIPWLEDDPALISPQLWAGRMRKDAWDALQYGCNGLIGIHWRTRIIDPGLNALAQGGWSLEPPIKEIRENRDFPVDDYYVDWARHQFGEVAGPVIAEVFTDLDGGPEFIPEEGLPYRANLFRTSGWDKGPGGIKIIREPWENIKDRFIFINQLEKIEPEITGPGNKERYLYWLNTFKFTRETARLGCYLGEIEEKITAIKKYKDEDKISSTVRDELMPLKQQMVNTYDEMMRLLLQTVTNSSEMGTIANLEQHNLITLKRLSRYDSIMNEATKKSMENISPEKSYNGLPRIIVQAPLGLIGQEDAYEITIRILSSEEIEAVTFNWAPLGEKITNSIKATHIARNVYKIKLEEEEISNLDFEYYISATFSEGNKILWPASAGTINQTVVVF